MFKMFEKVREVYVFVCVCVFVFESYIFFVSVERRRSVKDFVGTDTPKIAYTYGEEIFIEYDSKWTIRIEDKTIII